MRHVETSEALSHPRTDGIGSSGDLMDGRRAHDDGWLFVPSRKETAVMTQSQQTDRLAVCFFKLPRNVYSLHKCHTHFV